MKVADYFGILLIALISGVASASLRGNDRNLQQTGGPSFAGIGGQYVLDMVKTPSTSAYNPQSGQNPMYHSTEIDQLNNIESNLVIYLDPAATGDGGVEVTAYIQRNPNNGNARVSIVDTNTNSPGPRTREMMDALRRTRHININPNGRLSFNGNGSQLWFSPEDSWTPYTEP